MFEAVAPLDDVRYVPDDLDEREWWPTDEELEALIAGDKNLPPAPVVASDDDVPYLDDRLLVWVAAHEQLTPTMLARLAVIDPSRLDDNGRLDYNVACQRARNLFDGRLAEGVKAFAAAMPTGQVISAERLAAGELGPALALGSGATDDLLHVSDLLASRLPATLAAVNAGNVSWPKARTLALAVLPLTAEQTGAVEEIVLPKAARRTPAQHAAAVRRAVDRIDPDGADARRKDKERLIRLVRTHYGDGMGELFAAMPSEELDVTITAADVWARARKAAGDERTLDRLRVAFLFETAKSYLVHGDAGYCDRVCHHNDDGNGPDGTGGPDDTGPDDNGPEDNAPTRPSRHARPATITLTWDLSSLLGLTDHCGELLDSATSLPPAAMRDIVAAGIRARRILIEPATGELLDLTDRTWSLPATDGAAAHPRPYELRLVVDAAPGHVPAQIAAALDAADPALAAVLRELLDYPITAEDLDGEPDRPDPSPALAEFVCARDPHPVNPTAGPSPAKAGDIDHTIARNRGGKTVRANLGPLTRRWHVLKTHSDWLVTRIGRTWQWTSPLGRRYTTEPHDYRLGP